MKPIANSMHFVPRSRGLSERWGFVVTGVGEDPVIVEATDGIAWVKINEFTEDGAYLDELSRDYKYRISVPQPYSIAFLDAAPMEFIDGGIWDFLDTDEDGVIALHTI